MEIGFYSNKRKIEKNNCSRYDLNLRPSSYKSDVLVSMAIRHGPDYEKNTTRSSCPRVGYDLAILCTKIPYLLAF